MRGGKAFARTYRFAISLSLARASPPAPHAALRPKGVGALWAAPYFSSWAMSSSTTVMQSPTTL